VVLSDRTIKEQMVAGRIRIEPCDPDDIQPSSVDLHLGASFQVFRNSRYPYIDPSREQAG
jgi:dCTP deaminase